MFVPRTSRQVVLLRARSQSRPPPSVLLRYCRGHVLLRDRAPRTEPLLRSQSAQHASPPSCGPASAARFRLRRLRSTHFQQLAAAHHRQTVTQQPLAGYSRLKKTTRCQLSRYGSLNRSPDPRKTLARWEPGSVRDSPLSALFTAGRAAEKNQRLAAIPRKQSLSVQWLAADSASVTREAPPPGRQVPGCRYTEAAAPRAR